MLLALAVVPAACRRPAGGATGRWHGCVCKYLTDFDDAARIEIEVCVPASKSLADAATMCATGQSRNYAESCDCGPPREACDPGAPGACRNH